MISQFAKGDIVFHHFKTGNQNVTDGAHKSVVLHAHTIENATITICPISSLFDSNDRPKRIKPWHLILYKVDYPCLDHDSYVKLDQIITVDRSRVSPANNPGKLTPIDMISLDLKIISFYEMSRTTKKLLDKEMTKEIECLINDVDSDLKDHVKKGITDLISGVNRKVHNLYKDLDGDNQAELVKTLIKVDVDIITKVTDVIDEVLIRTKKKYLEKYKSQ